MSSFHIWRLLCTQLWRHPDKFHQLWADAWVAWLHKPGKAPDQPENLRPISLTEGGGRIVVKALAMRLRPFFAEATRLWPQYAYTPGRSIEHAIARALHHCAQVRHTLASHRLTLKERRATGHKPTSCQGGATLSVDTSKAFDTVDRRVLEQELRAARVPEPDTGPPAPTPALECPARGVCARAVLSHRACGPSSQLLSFVRWQVPPQCGGYRRTPPPSLTTSSCNGFLPAFRTSDTCLAPLMRAFVSWPGLGSKCNIRKLNSLLLIRDDRHANGRRPTRPRPRRAGFCLFPSRTAKHCDYPLSAGSPT